MGLVGPALICPFISSLCITANNPPATSLWVRNCRATSPKARRKYP